MDVNDTDFEKKVLTKSETTPVVVDFWAPWCMPCTMLGPILEKLEKEYRGKWILAKLNVDSCHQKAAKYEIRGIPAVKMFKDGKVAAEFVGSMPESSVRAWLGKNL